MDTAVLPYQQLFGCRQTGSGVSGRKILKESCDATVTVYDADTEEPYIIAAKTCENPKFQLLLEGHLDVVSPEGMEHPFDAEIKDGILYGRGSVDMKGGCGSMLAAFVNACQKPLEGDLYLMFSTDEEYAGEEIKKALERIICRKWILP